MVNPVLYAVLLSAVAGGATGLGAIPLSLKRRFTHRFYDSIMGLSAGVMLSAATFSLIEPALTLGALWQVLGGFTAGALFIAILNWAIPHAHTRFTHGGKVTEERRRGMLIAGAVAIHNVPEGFAVAYPFHEDGRSTVACLMIATLSGLAEPVGALLGALLISVEAAVLPFGLGFAAGAMVYVVFAEMVPESHSHGYSESATLTAIVGFVLVMALNLIIAK